MHLTHHSSVVTQAGGGARRSAAGLPAMILPMLGIGVLLSAPVALAREYIVAGDGDDANPGTQQRPLRTVQKAADLARAGDTVLVRAGVYEDGDVTLTYARESDGPPIMASKKNDVLRFRHSGMPDRPIVLRNYPGECPVLEGRVVLSAEKKDGKVQKISWIRIEGLEIRHGHDGIKMYNGYHIVIRNTYIHDTWNQGILGNGQYIRVEGNLIARIGRRHVVLDWAERRKHRKEDNADHGIYGDGWYWTVVNNVIMQTDWNGIVVAAYDYEGNEHKYTEPRDAEASRWLIAHNTFAYCNDSGITMRQASSRYEGGHHHVIQNNIFYNNARRPGSSYGHGVYFYENEGTGNIVRNNLFFAPDRKGTIVGGKNRYTATDNIEGKEPLFVNPQESDFRPRAGSPAIDTATRDVPADRGCGPEPVTNDRAGNPRPCGRGADIGAYEFVGTPR
ncbi:MAG: right-handed parallel beta-helix repeat-containing protein [Kiritimatiellae bacterium]|nr:right-handed parallel beta-helix repeat-containing protein [Kiritimatiellia bacterium]